MPSDIIAEKVVLAGLYQHQSSIYYEVADILTSDCFTDEANQGVFVAIRSLYIDKKVTVIDYPSLVATLNELGYQFIINNKSEVQHLKSIINTVIEKENIKSWCIKLRKLDIARKLKLELQDAGSKVDKVTGAESFGEILSYAEYPIQNFSQSIESSVNRDIVSIHDGVNEYIKLVEENPVDIVGISTGYPKLDLQIGGGLRSGSITLVGARTGFGKSLLSVNIGLFASIKLNIPVLYLDTEMGLSDHQPRILSNLTYDNDVKITINDIERGKYAGNPSKKQSIDVAINKFTSSKFFYSSICGKPFEEHLSLIRKWLYKNVGFTSSGVVNPCVIIYDYIKIGSAAALRNNIEERQALAFMMMGMHDFAQRYKFPVLMLTQLNREGIDKEDQSVIRGSDSALDPVTNFCIFKGKSPEEIQIDGSAKGDAKIVVLKSRHGESHYGGNYISYHKIGKYAKILEVK